MQGQKARVVGVGMHHDDLALSGGLAVQLAGQLGLGRCDVSLGHQGVEAAGEQGFPEVAAFAHGPQLFLDLGAPATGDVGQGAGVLRQQGLDALTPVPDQHGRRAGRGNGHLDGAAVDDGRGDEGAALRIVDRVAQQVAGLGGLEHLAVHFGIAGGRDHQEDVLQVLWVEFARQPLDAPFVLPVQKGRRQFAGHHADVGAGL